MNLLLLGLVGVGGFLFFKNKNDKKLENSYDEIKKEIFDCVPKYMKIGPNYEYIENVGPETPILAELSNFKRNDSDEKLFRHLAKIVCKKNVTSPFNKNTKPMSIIETFVGYALGFVVLNYKYYEYSLDPNVNDLFDNKIFDLNSWAKNNGLTEEKISQIDNSLVLYKKYPV